MYKHFIWTFFDRPRITTIETFDKCLIDAKFSKLVSGDYKESISLTFGQRDCVKKSSGFDILILESISEFSENKTLKTYPFSTPIKFKIDKSDSLSVLVDYYSSDVNVEVNLYKIQFSLNGTELMQQELPHYSLTPLKTLLKVKIANISTNSCDSNIRLDFHVISSKKSEIKIDMQRFTYDYYAFGVFKSFEIYHKPIENETLSRMSFFWKDVSYSDVQNKRSSMLTADLEDFQPDDHIETLFPLISPTIRKGSIHFIAKNNENCFYRKKYLTWLVFV